MKIFEEGSQRQKIIVNIFIILFALFSLKDKKFDEQSTTAFDELMINIFSPIQGSVSYMKSTTTNIFEDYIFNINAKRKNRELEKKVSLLESELFNLKQVSKENERLKNLLKFGESSTLEKVLAQVVAWDTNSNFKTLRINKGRIDGINLQSPVVTSDGLVGFVVRLTDHYSDIITILDANNRVDSIVERTRSLGIVEGFSKHKAMMKYISGTKPLILGDLVLTSGLGNIYPKGLKIGKIVKIERESYGLTQQIEIKPTVDFSSLEEVVVLIKVINENKTNEWKALDDIETEQK